MHGTNFEMLKISSGIIITLNHPSKTETGIQTED
jgi:hypothetical protein